MESEMASTIDGDLEKAEGASQDIATDQILEPEVLKQKYPGCFKKSVAFLIDQIIIAIIGIVVFFPFSKYKVPQPWNKSLIKDPSYITTPSKG